MRRGREGILKWGNDWTKRYGGFRKCGRKSIMEFRNWRFEWLSALKEQGYGINNLGLEFGSYTKQAPLSRADEGKLPLFFKIPSRSSSCGKI